MKMFSIDTPGNLYIFGYNGDAFCMNGTYRLVSSKTPTKYVSAESKWCVPGSTYHITLLQGLSCRLDAKRVTYG